MLGFENWTFWFHHADEVLEASGVLRRAEHRSPDIPDALRVRALDALVAASQAGQAEHQMVTSAALIGLAKVTSSREHVDLLVGVLRSREQDLLAAESAALGLGLLRRSDADGSFDADTLDRARGALFTTLEDDSVHARTRGFAALALGLLGDQPTGSQGWSAAGSTQRLFKALNRRYAHPDMRIAVLRALARQPLASFTTAQRDVLLRLVREGTLGGQSVREIHRAHAVLTMGHIGASESVEPLASLMTQRSVKSVNIRRSAALALSTLLPRLNADERGEVLGHLMRAALHAEQDDTVRHFATMGLVHGVLAAPHTEVGPALREPAAREALLALAAYGRQGQRPHAALGVGILLAMMPRSPDDTLRAFKPRALAVLRRGLAETDARNRAAFALALGIARDAESEAALRAIVQDGKQDPELRGYAELGLAYLGTITSGSREVLGSGRREGSNYAHRLLSDRVLGLLGAESAVDVLRRDLVAARDSYTKGEAAAALARIGSRRALVSLLAVATDKDEDPHARGAAYAGVGRLLDLDRGAALARLRGFLNYRASTDLINELLSIL